LKIIRSDLHARKSAGMAHLSDFEQRWLQLDRDAHPGWLFGLCCSFVFMNFLGSYYGMEIATICIAE
jgi:hypothetical protein